MAVTRPESDWRWHLARQLNELGPLAQGRFVPHAGALEQIRGVRLLEAESLRTTIARTGPVEESTEGGPRDADPRIGVSRMARLYCMALSWIAFAGLANGVGIDLSSDRYAVVFDDDSRFLVTTGPEYGGEVLRCAERPTSWPVNGPVVETLDELYEYVWINLYSRNMALVFRRATEIVNVPERLLWTNAAEGAATVLDVAIEFLGDAAAPFAADCQALLTADSLPGMSGPNPLRGRLSWPPYAGGPRHGIQTRRLCCLVYQQTDRRGRLCQNCPLLPLPDRAALVLERRWRGVTEPAGPAEQRCAEVGLRQLRVAARRRQRHS